MADADIYELNPCRNASEDVRVPWKMVKKDKIKQESDINGVGYSHGAKHHKMMKQKIQNHLTNAHKRQSTIDCSSNNFPVINEQSLHAFNGSDGKKQNPTNNSLPS